MGDSRTITMASILLICFALITISPVRAEHSVGVQKGDWIQYRLKETSGVGDAETKIVDNWLKITINDITGSSVSVTVDSDEAGWNSQNLTEDVASDCELNLLTAPLPTSDLMAKVFIVPANLSASDSIPMGYIQETINDVTQHSGHDTIHYNNPMLGMGATQHTDIWWDRPKGVLLEYNYTFSGGGRNQVITATLESTNIWSNPSDWLLPAIIAVIIVIVVVAVALLVMRGRKRVATRPVQQPPPTSAPAHQT